MRAIPGLVVVGCLVLAGSAAQAAPAATSSRHKKAKRPAEPPPPPPEDSAEDDRGADAPAEPRKVAPEEVALETGPTDSLDDRDTVRDTPRVVKSAAPADHGWEIAIGPYLWASSVDANVSLGGPISTGVDIGFVPLVRHARYGAELLAEVRHGRFAMYGDLMYGAEAVNGSTSVASLMVTLSGSASSLLVDGAVGYELIGDEDSVFSLEARAGIRYQGTEIDGSVDVAGISVQSPPSVDDGSDLVAGARAVLRPAHWVFFSGVFDHGVVGASERTWSASADANLRVSSHFLISAGWRTLTLDRSLVSLTMQGPRAAVQLVF
jgi:hypothetical protein